MTDLSNNYIPRELSWLSFNGRVLQEAADPSVPLIERVRFLGIYSSNLDEFFKVKVAELKRQVIINKAKDKDNDDSVQLLKNVQNEATRYQKTLNHIYKELLSELGNQNIFMRDNHNINEEQKKWVVRYFQRHVLKHINPVIIDADTDLVSFLRDQFTYLLVDMTSKEGVTHALIEIPTDKVPRFVKIPSEGADIVNWMFLDDVIRVGMHKIFEGLFNYDKIEAYSIKMNRDAEYDLNGDIDRSVLENMSESLKQRLNAMPVRFSYDANMPEEMVRFMAKELKMSSIDSMMGGNRYHNFKDFLSFPNFGSSRMENPSLPEIKSTQFDTAITPFDAIAKKDVLVYYPYYSFDYFTEFLRHASYDPKVSSIKINIYRVASNSRVIDSLMHAANNGKSVTVVVELKARFDEANNVKWASRLTQAGVKVLFGLPTLKIHSKLCLITRHEDGKVVRYAHVGTGNFNEKTARIYTDFALFTANPKVTKEVDDVFTFIEYPYTRPVFENLLVSPLNARERITFMIDREIENAKQGREASIHFKVNALVDEPLVMKLYEASQAGVKIRGVVRGMCSLRPGIDGLSENIYITSIVDRFLEHPRVMIFHNGGDEEMYISSADWMRRNLDFRIEVGCRILDEDLQKRIKGVLELQENDNRKARIIDADQRNVYVQCIPGEPQIRSQIAIHDYLQEQEDLIADGEKE